MRLVINVFILLTSFFLHAHLFAQNTLEINGHTYQDEQAVVCHLNCIVAPGNPQQPVIVTGNSQVQYRAGKCIELKPGFKTESFVNTSFFEAKIGLQDYELAVVEASDIPNKLVEKHRKIEFGVHLPQDIQDDVDLFLFGLDQNQDDDFDDPGDVAPYTQGLNPYDPDQLKVDMVLTDPSGGTRTIYGFYYEEFVRQTQFPSIATEPWWIYNCTRFPADGLFWGDDRQLTGYHRWRVRFSPAIEGVWMGSMAIEVNGQSRNELSCIGFTCTSTSVNNGHVKVSDMHSNYGDRYLRWSDPVVSNPTFFANSMNAVWPLQTTGINYDGIEEPLTIGHRLESDDYLDYYDGNGGGWLEKMANGGINTVSIGMLHWTYGLEWDKVSGFTNDCTPNESGLGNYHLRMRNAWEFDYLVDKITALNMQLIPQMDIHDQYQWETKYNQADGTAIYGTNGWPENPYRSLPDVTDPIDFFDLSTSAGDYYKRKLRYIAARWGYSNNILFWEMLSEMNNAGLTFNHTGIAGNDPEDKVHPFHNNSTFRNHVNNWFDEMASHFRTITAPYRPHYMVGSFEQTDSRNDLVEVFRSSDIISLHDYGEPKRTGLWEYTFVNHDNRWPKSESTRFLDFTNFFQKPLFYDEGHKHEIDRCHLGLYHNSIWATSFMGCFGNITSWYWDELDVWQPNYYDEHQGLANFMNQIDLVGGNYSPRVWQSKPKNLEAFALVDEDKKQVYGWVNNIRVKWDGRFQSNGQGLNDCLEDLIAPPGGYEWGPDWGPLGNWLWIESVPVATKFEVHDLIPQTLNANPKYFIVFVDTDDGTTTSTVIDETTNFSGVLKIPLLNALNSGYSDVAFIACHEDIYGSKSMPQDLARVIKETVPDYNGLAVFPNPNNGRFSLMLEQVPESGYSILVTDASGRSVYQREGIPSIKWDVDLSDHPDGIYVIRAVVGEQVYTQRFVKQ